MRYVRTEDALRHSTKNSSNVLVTVTLLEVEERRQPGSGSDYQWYGTRRCVISKGSENQSWRHQDPLKARPRLGNNGKNWLIQMT